MPTLDVTEDPDLFTPNAGAQAEFLDDHSSRYCAFAGGMGAGKSYVGSRKAANLHAFNAFRDDGRPTYCHSLLVAESYQLARTVNIPQLRAAFDAIGLRHRFVSDPKLYAFELPDLGTKRNPSYFYVRSAEAAESIAGFEVGTVWGDEAARWPWAQEGEDPIRDAFVQADGRLRHPGARFHQFNLTYTNEGQDTRVYQDFEAEPKAGHRLHRGSTRENQHLPPDYVNARLATMSADLVSQYIDGHAAKLGANLVYHCYDPARNDDAELGLVDGIPLQLAVDFNVAPGMHATLGQYLGDDRLTTVHEFHKPGMLVKTLAAAVYYQFGKGLLARRWPALDLFGDPAGNARSARDGVSCWDELLAEFAFYRIPVRLRVPTRAPMQVDRANAANSALLSADGRVRWRIHPQCVRLIRDLRNVKWGPDRKIAKANASMTHMSDADTYRVHYLMPIRRHEESNARPAAVPQPA